MTVFVERRTYNTNKYTRSKINVKFERKTLNLR